MENIKKVPRVKMNPVHIIGAGLAGSEAAYQLASRNIPVRLVEMRPKRPTEAHISGNFAELVCSNSFGSDTPHHASRILKDELTILDSFVLRIARNVSVPAGSSLAVDRDLFSKRITKELKQFPMIECIEKECTELPDDGIVLIASGPLTTPLLSKQLCEWAGRGSLYFYDAISPIVSYDSLDLSKMYFANRYGKGTTSDFLNIPLSKDQYEDFIADLLSAEVVLPHDFEEEKYFEGCMPIEALAARGHKTLAFGPMRPVGLENPADGRRPYAVIQLRTENEFKTAFNLVGFQTKLKYNEQLRVFRKLPGLGSAEFLRLGSMHRNTYLDSPRVLTPTLQLRSNQRIFVAGQLTGTEGYLEASAMGLLAGRFIACVLEGKTPTPPPRTTLLGALIGAITDKGKSPFQPMNANYGILPPIEMKFKDKALRNELFANRSSNSLMSWLDEGHSILPESAAYKGLSC